MDPELSLSSVANAVSVSPNHLSTLFKSKIGVGFSEYLTEVRIRQAKRLLITSDLRVSEVGERVGYQNMEYFSMLFKKNTGRRPASTAAPTRYETDESCSRRPENRPGPPWEHTEQDPGGFTVILVGMLSINLLVIGLSHHFLGEYHILAERVISANKLIPTVRDDVSLDAYYLVAGRRTLETTQLFHHMEEIRQGLYLLKQENNSENGRIQLQIATRTFGTLQRYCQKLGQEIDADVSLELQNVTLEQIRDVSALVYNQIEEYIYLELLWGESIDQMLQTGFQLLLLGDLAAVVLMVAVLAFLLMRINRTINDPIQALVENTRRLAEGDFDALMEDAGENEVTILNKSFNRMAAKLQRLMEKVEEDTRTQEQLELRLLQEQINPHFLYNTLEIIVWLAESGDKEQVIQVVQSLSRFFRVVLSKGRAVVSLRRSCPASKAISIFRKCAMPIS